MALIMCPECQHNISDKAQACPKCGYPISEFLTAQRCVGDKINNSLEPSRNYDSNAKKEKTKGLEDNNIDNLLFGKSTERMNNSSTHSNEYERAYCEAINLEKMGKDGKIECLYGALELYGQILDYKDSRERKSIVQTMIYERQKEANVQADYIEKTKTLYITIPFAILSFLSFILVCISGKYLFLSIPVLVIVVTLVICYKLGRWRDFWKIFSIASWITFGISVILFVIVLILG